MNVFLWIVQIVLAAAFVLAGVTKATHPKEKLTPKLPWVEDFSTGTVRLIGVAQPERHTGPQAPSAGTRRLR